MIMATSIQVVGDKAAVLDDMDLLLLLRIMVERVHSNCDRFPTLQSMAVHWESSWEDSGPGTLDLDLASLARNNSQTTEFLSIVHETERTLREFGDVLPAAIVNRRWNVRGVKFHDYPINRLNKTLEELRRLLAT